MAPWYIPDFLTSYLMEIVMFALSLIICGIIAKIINLQKFDLEINVKVKKEKTELASFD